MSSPEWRFYANSEFGSYQYDAKYVRHLSKGLVRVQQKLMLNGKSRNDLVGELGKESQNLKEIIILREIEGLPKIGKLEEP